MNDSSLTRVPVAPLRDRFLEMRSQGIVTAYGIARSLEWWRRPSPAMREEGPVPDASRVTRALGVTGHRSRGDRYFKQHIGHDLAERLCPLLGLDPWEVGV